MGRPKPSLPLGRMTLIEWIVDRLAPGFEAVLVAAASPEQLPPALRPHLVRDLHLGAGPLAGIEAGLAATGHPVLVAVACDMPYVTPGLLSRLVSAIEGHDAAVPRVRGRPEPTCAAYRTSAAGPIAAALSADRRRAAQVLDELDVRWVEGEDPALFASLNTEADYRAFLDAVRYSG